MLKRWIWRWFIPHSHGEDNMRYIGMTPARFGDYQVYECRKCGVQEAI